MITTEELETIMRRAMVDRRDEAAFLRALLDAPLYVLRPVSDDHSRLRLAMFQQPNGTQFVPCFTNREKAEFCAGSTRVVIELLGRVLFESTRGAIFVINPNDEHCTIYPEEIRALLCTGFVAMVESEQMESTERLFGIPQSAPAWLAEAVHEVCATLPFIEAVGLLGMQDPQVPGITTLLLCVTAPAIHAERVARAITTRVQPLCAQHNVPVDIITTELGKTFLEGDAQLEGLLLYRRRG